MVKDSVNRYVLLQIEKIGKEVEVTTKTSEEDA